jgi:DNA-binding response OmpR family regulator
MGPGRTPTERRRLTKLEWAVLTTLAEAYGELVAHGDLVSKVYRATGRPASPLNVLKVVVCHLRGKLAGTPLQVENIFGQGYRLRPPPSPARGRRSLPTS